jgi:thiol-disulfide isomerase/thioredoxin
MIKVKLKIKKYLIELIKLLVVVAIVLNVVSYFKSQNLNKENLSIDSFTLLDDSNYTVAKNKPLLIHFWATWCPICDIEASNIEFISKHFEVLTIAVQSSSKMELETYLQQNNLSFKVVNDYDGAIAKQFNISVYPTTFIYDKDKNLISSEVGYTSTVGLYLRMLWASL